MSTQDSSAVPGWGTVQSTPVPHHDGVTVMDGIKLGVGLAIAWCLIVPLVVIVVAIMLGSLR